VKTLEPVKTSIDLSVMEEVQPAKNGFVFRIAAKGQIYISQKVYKKIRENPNWQSPIRCGVFLSKDGSTIALRIGNEGICEIVERANSQFIITGISMKSALEEKGVQLPCKYSRINFDEKSSAYFGKLIK
jgi:hypothetical protein